MAPVMVDCLVVFIICVVFAGGSKWNEALRLVEKVERFGVTLIGLGNGKGCREVEATLGRLIATNELKVSLLPIINI